MNLGFLNVVREMAPLMLSHHPSCDKYRDDVFRIGPVSLCIGCTVSYPIAAAVFVLYLTFHVPPIDAPLILIIGCACGLLQLLSLAGKTRPLKVKVLTKVFLGLGLGWTASGILSLDIAVKWRIALLAVAALGICILGFMRYFNLRRTCASCEWAGRESECPGLKGPTSALDGWLGKEEKRE